MDGRKMKSRKAVSPAISAAILVGVAIAVSVAVAFWLGGMTGQYANFEKVELQSGVCVISGATGGECWNITLKLKNTGTATSIIIGCFINDVEVDGYGVTSAVDGDAVTTITDSEPIESGVSKYVSILIDYDNYKSLTSGTTVNIKIISAGGMEYIKLIELVQALRKYKRQIAFTIQQMPVAQIIEGIQIPLIFKKGNTISSWE